MLEKILEEMLSEKGPDKIKASSAEIVVHGTREKPYYEIKYYDLSDNEYHIGFSSYSLDVVWGYLDGCFEIVDKYMSDGKDINVPINNNWIPVEERLPKDDRYVLVCNVRGARDLAWWDGNGKRWWTGFSHADIARDVIAWQPLPDPYTLKKETETDCFKVPVDTACLIRSRQN